MFRNNNSLFKNNNVNDSSKQLAERNAQFALNLAKAQQCSVPSQVGVGLSKQTQDAIHQHNITLPQKKR